ncbi:hypothetical protein FRC04_004346 [Tulasnella sp. 424]|nr:hypothetical protein FRC04_004346 [Tulasnella sp. 424]KAG8979462.1 hypothetical protein FRC05_008448 [Tulasnella sp. 425]
MSSNPSASTIQVPSSSASAIRASPQKSQIRTYDSKLISREMDRLAMQTSTPPLHPSHSHSHSHTGLGAAVGIHGGHGMTPTGSVSTLTLVPNLSTHSGTSPLTASSSATLITDDPWAALHLHVLPLFNGEPLRMPIEDLNAFVKKHLVAVVSKAPSRAISTLENDLVDLISTGMITLNAKLNGKKDEELLNRVVELWNFFWTQLLPYIEGVFLPLQIDQLLVNLSRTPRVVRPTSPVDSMDRDSSPPNQSTLTSAPIDVRTLTLRSFRDALILPVFERLHLLIASAQTKEKDARNEYNQPRFQQMLLVLTSIQTPSVSLSMNEAPLSPGEHAIAQLLRAVRNPSSSVFPLNQYPNGHARRRTMGPSSFSGGAPRDRRGRIARKDEAVYSDSAARILGITSTGVDPDETPTVGGLAATTGPEDLQRIQRMRDEREFLDSLKSPDIDGDPGKQNLIGNAAIGQLPQLNGNSQQQYANMQVDYDSADDRSEEEDFGTEIQRPEGYTADWESGQR